MRRTRMIALAAAAVAVLPVGAASATVPGANGLIAFERGGDIWTVRPDGTDGRPLVVSPSYDSTPAWSADGKRLAFARDNAVWVIGADGTGERKVADAPGASHPVWSPDGSRIAFQGLGTIQVVNSAGGAPVV